MSSERSSQISEDLKPEPAGEAASPTANPRVAVRIPARISTIDPETDPFTGKSFFRTSEESSANLSRGGVFVAMREPIPPGRRVLVELEIPGDRSIQTVGRVAWTRVGADEQSSHAPAGMQPGTSEPGVGIQLLSGRRDDLHALETFVTRSIRRGAEQQPGVHDVATGT